ncbi:MAG: class I SAM-dependent methyltransferase, partial [Draconibacterium sp.]|nr:class I SAM-dependent methyltransferase [Draconibacterium sp.]
GPNPNNPSPRCGIGAITKMFALKCTRVIAFENNPELLNEAEKANSAPNIEYKNSDIAHLDYDKLPSADGIWSSFVPSYFPEFTPVLKSWLKILKPNGWIAFVEMSDLFNHRPLCKITQKIFEDYYERQCSNNTYDFTMGSKLADFVRNCGLTIFHKENMQDKELNFDGPADERILESWVSRFNRMTRFQEYLGEEKFTETKNEFSNCLSHSNHRSNTIVKFVIARK